MVQENLFFVLIPVTLCCFHTGQMINLRVQILSS
uniref:Uncharacterized protein n=1 Tax=Rhizophora mucronata TaxID=61149 RepID=A0A2P2QF28_RHIMU